MGAFSEAVIHSICKDVKQELCANQKNSNSTRSGASEANVGKSEAVTTRLPQREQPRASKNSTITLDQQLRGS